MNRYLLNIITMTFMGCSLPLSAEAKRHGRSDALTDSVMCRIFRYAQQVDTTGRSNSTSYAYTKFQMRTNKRNATHARAYHVCRIAWSRKKVYH